MPFAVRQLFAVPHHGNYRNTVPMNYHMMQIQNIELAMAPDLSKLQLDSFHVQ